ncbi:MAG: hypothetical protein JW837_05665 [Sedimentisphaerales bacterium]|nr:hypothetical protein [Sedimentisphaerales bacterium]
MKKILIQTINVCILLSLITAGFAVAQDAVVQQSQVNQTSANEVAQGNYGIAMNMNKNPYGSAWSAGVAIPHLQHGGSGSVMVIPSAQMEIENLVAVNEDMNVMSRIFEKKLSQSNLITERERWFLGRYPWLAQGSGSAPEAVYLEGYGALFLLRVNILLSAPPEAPKEEKTEKEDTDPLWTQMRREMYEPEQADGRNDDRREEKYDAQKVENLKTDLINTLKHATNIRGLKPEQLVILTVIGSSSRSGPDIMRSYSHTYGRSGVRTGTGTRRITVPEVEEDSLLPTVLTISAKKSDIDAFAKGEIDYDQFSKRIGIFGSYAQAGL